MAASLEFVLDKLAEALITSGHFTPEVVKENQKTIRDGVRILGRANSEKLLLFETDIKANQKDLGTASDITMESGGNTSALTSLNDIIGHCIDDTTVAISHMSAHGPSGDYLSNIYFGCATTSGNSQWDITGLVYSVEGENGFNISQFMNLEQSGSNVDPNQANEFLDTTIYELLPVGKTRQERIDDLFAEVSTLQGNAPLFSTDDYGDIDPPVDYEENHDISYAQENDDGVEEEESFITRLNIDANAANKDKTIQSLRDTLNTYLLDIDQVIEAELDDSRPEYKAKSDGYLKIRNLNQGIIIRKQEGDDIGIEQEITINDADHPHYGMTGPSYLQDGFTISMWTRFLDKTSKGTLFNYGNPLRSKDPRGFVLETYVLNKDDVASTSENDETWYDLSTGTDLFSNSDSERFIRLVVYDHLIDDDGIRKLYDSSKGIPGIEKEYNIVPEFGMDDATEAAAYTEGYEKGLLTHTRVPIDFNEWYFIVANFNPMVNDLHSATTTIPNWKVDPNYWNGNINDSNAYTHYSGLGNKCKVEIISKSDLLRARGYKV